MTTSHPASEHDLRAGDFHFLEEIVVDAAPETVYDLICNVANIATWSPTASDVMYDQGNGPQPGAWFSGANERNGRRWRTRSQVDAASRPSTFSFVVGGIEDGIVRWTWRFAPRPAAHTSVSLNWELERLDPVLGESRAELDALQEFMRESVRATLAALARHFNRPTEASTFSESDRPGLDG